MTSGPGCGPAPLSPQPALTRIRLASDNPGVKGRLAGIVLRAHFLDRHLALRFAENGDDLFFVESTSFYFCMGSAADLYFSSVQFFGSGQNGLILCDHLKYALTRWHFSNYPRSMIDKIFVFSVTWLLAGLLSAQTIVQKTVADSSADFLQSFPAEGVPDAKGWNYGWYDLAADADNIYNYEADFQQFANGQTRGNGFGVVASGGPWTSVNAENKGHPHGGGAEQWPIRRYTVEAGTPSDATINWLLAADNAGGSGTTLNVYRNGNEIATATTRQAAGLSGSVEVEDLSVGDVIDFALTPVGDDGSNSQGSDGSFFGGTVTTTFETQGVVADTVADFSGQQGEGGWTYGYLDAFTNNQPAVGDDHGGTFTAFDGGYWNGSKWDFPSNPPWTEITNVGGHPASGPTEQWATRRWTVPETEEGDLLVEFDLVKPNNAGGTTVFVMHNGTVVNSVQTNGALVEDWVKISSVSADDTIDIALSPLFNGNAADGSDASNFSAKIHLLVTEVDLDSDGLPDAWEETYSPGDLSKLSGLGDADFDNDGSTDLAEYIAGTDPTFDPDTDADGLPDVWEENYSPGDLTKLSGLGDVDFDDDGLTDLAEYNAETDPTNGDSDGDGLEDGAEIATHNTDPLKSDTDGDLLSDGDEVNSSGTSPLLADSDSDGLSDKDEIDEWETDPLVSNLIGDSVTEFSGVQGQEGWSYGYLDDFNNNQPLIGDAHGGRMNLFPADGTNVRQADVNLWNGTNWDFVANPPWTTISNVGGHPASSPTEQWATRQWTAAAADTGDILVSYNLSKPNNGGGTTLFIVHNGIVVGSAQSNNVGGVTDSVRINNVIPGDTVDVALSPLFNGNAGDGGDASNFGAKINLLVAREPADADVDGLEDSWENRYTPDDLTQLSGLDGADYDNDGSSDLAEFEAGTDPTDEDSDDDGLKDGAETNTGVFVNADDAGTDPLSDDSDSDGLKDNEEVAGIRGPATDPTDDDTDDDGLADGAEVDTWQTNPINANTDGDSASDGEEVSLGFDPLDAVSDPATSLADSRTGFSGIQGENGWNHGYRNLTADGGAQDYDPQSDFIAFSAGVWNGANSKWDLGPNAPWTELGKENTHPNGINNQNNGGMNWTVRRWTAGADVGAGKPVALRWNVRKASVGGTGVTGAVHINGVRMDSLTIAGNDRTGEVRTYYANIFAGDTIDLILAPDGVGNDQADGSDGSFNWITIDGYIPPNPLQPDGSVFVPAATDDLSITNVVYNADSGTVTLTWPSVSGRIYAIDTSTGLSAEGTEGGWLEYDDSIPGVEGEASFVIVLGNPVPSALFMRVRDITNNE